MYSIILFKVDKTLKINLYYIILSLDQAIYLRVKSIREFPLNIKKII